MLEDESMPSNAMPANIPSSLDFTLGRGLYFNKRKRYSRDSQRISYIYINSDMFAVKLYTAPRPHHPSYVTKATQTGTPIPDPSAVSDSEQEIVTFTVAEMLWMKRITTDLLRNEEELKIRQADILTAIGDVEDKNESLRDDVTRLEVKIRALEIKLVKHLVHKRGKSATAKSATAAQ